MKINKFLIIALAAVALTACSDFLDEESYRTDYTYYESPEGIESLVGAAYQQTRWSAGGENHYLFEDLGSDIYMSGGDGAFRDAFGEYASNGMNPSNAKIAEFWNNNYSGIASCNLALQYLAANTEMDAERKNIRTGEMLFLRAYYYYELVVQFGDIPLILEPVDKPKTDYVRSPQKEVWRQVISDLRAAWDLLPWAPDGKVTDDYGRASKGAAGHLLAKAYLFRHGTLDGGSQSVAQMQEDRGAAASDLDSVIYYAGRVAGFGEGVGGGSPHTLAENFSDLWGWDPKTGMTAEYFGPEVLFSVQYSANPFYNNRATATDIDNGGSWLHLLYLMMMESLPTTTPSRVNGEPNVSWGTNIGVVRDFITGRSYKRIVQTPYVYQDNGLFGRQAYDTPADGKPGKLVDARIYKSHVWVYYCNTAPQDVNWTSFSNGAGSFDPASIGQTVGTPRYAVGDTAILLSLENLDERFTSGQPYEKLALARAQEPYWYVPMQSMFVPTVRAQAADRDGICMTFPTLLKHLSTYRGAFNYRVEAKNFIRMRLGETLLILSEAYARKGEWGNAAEALNRVRVRSAWKDGESKYTQFWKYDGGTYADRFTSTEAGMRVSERFLSGFTPDELTDFYVEEYGRELMGELNRFDVLARFGADYWLKRVQTHNHFAAANVKIHHRFRPIPQAHIDLIDPMEAVPQNYGYGVESN